ncbi:MAG: hypothetical protein Q9174_005244 [Haloplaca sp. 1 TL-2023]
MTDTDLSADELTFLSIGDLSGSGDSSPRRIPVQATLGSIPPDQPGTLCLMTESQESELSDEETKTLVSFHFDNLPEQQLLPRTRLCAISPFFNEYFMQDWRRNALRRHRCYVRDTDPFVYQLFENFVKGDFTLEKTARDVAAAYPPTGTAQDDDDLREAICQLHSLAREWRIVALEDRCIDHLRMFRGRNLMNFGGQKYRLISETEDPASSPLWRLAVDQFAWTLKSKPMTNEQVQALLEHVTREFEAEVILCLVQPEGPVDPRMVDGCIYHRHDLEVECHLPMPELVLPEAAVSVLPRPPQVPMNGAGEVPTNGEGQVHGNGAENGHRDVEANGVERSHGVVETRSLVNRTNGVGNGHTTADANGLGDGQAIVGTNGLGNGPATGGANGQENGHTTDDTNGVS